MSALIVAAAALATGDASASAQRTFVASYGNDANPCSRTQPCRSFSAALAQAIGGGEVIALDSAGYGPITITQSVSVIAPDGVRAGISAPSNVAAVQVDAVGSVVVLRGLAITAGVEGIHWTHGRSLTIERCEVSGMGSTGIVANVADGSLITIRDTSVADNLFAGISAVGRGRAALQRVSVSRSRFGAGVEFNLDAGFSVRDSMIANNAGAGISVTGGSTLLGGVPMTIASSEIVANQGAGIDITVYTSHGASVVVSDTEIARNNMALTSAAGGVFVHPSFGSSACVTLLRSTIHGNGGHGVEVSGTGTYGIVDGCVVVANGQQGLFADANGATIFTRGNNVIHGNPNGNVLGTVLQVAPH
jgi:hypothetical protein